MGAGLSRGYTEGSWEKDGFVKSLSSSDTPRVSVIVPNYNHARYLAQRVDSILGQTWGDYEVIILDDASTDGSQAVIETYCRNSRIRSIVNTANSGSACHQWNRGMREARGEYVWIAESDDYADVRFLETMVARLDARPAVGLVYCDSHNVAANGEIIGRQSEYYRLQGVARWGKDFDNTGLEEVRDQLMYWNSIPNASAVLIRKTVYERVGGAPEDFRLCGDWMTWVKVLLASDLSYVAEPLNYFRCHRETVRGTTANALSLREHYRVSGYIARHLKLGPESLGRVRNHIAAKWISALLENPAEFDGPRFQEVYRVALLVDKYPWARLMKQFCLYWPRKVYGNIRDSQSLKTKSI